MLTYASLILIYAPSWKFLFRDGCEKEYYRTKHEILIIKFENIYTHVHASRSGVYRENTWLRFGLQRLTLWTWKINHAEKSQAKHPLKQERQWKASHEIVKLYSKMSPVHNFFTGWIKCTAPFKFIRNITLFI